MTATQDRRTTFELADRYRAGSGPVLLTGVQAVGRLIAEQHRADAEAGLRTGTFVSGYPGSPLGGLDRTLASAEELAALGMRLVPGVNEELAATAVWGSQLELADRPWTVDGVVGLWYGKAPGVDRVSDPVRHANLCGTHPRGGVLLLAGDDPGCKSSTIPSASERLLAALNVPVLYPADAADLVRLGRYGVELSRISGCWVGMKITADVADGLVSVTADAGSVPIVRPPLEWEGRPWERTQTPLLLPPASLSAEEQLRGPRWAMVSEFLACNPIDAIELDTPAARLAIVAGGTVYAELRHALAELGLDDDTLRAGGIRLLRLGVIHPVDRGRVRRVAAGVARVLVVEEKGPFLESAVRDALYGLPDAPAVLGSHDDHDRPLIPPGGQLTAAALLGPLRRVLAEHVVLPAPAAERIPLELLPVRRTPHFCSGCPHNRSTEVPVDAVSGGGIGCHAMVAISPRQGGAVNSLTQMGGEGAQWIGQSAFLPDTAPHMFQNLGDGTFAHSGQLAVQACMAAGVDITFKLLYNSAVAMTGGQHAEGGLEVPEITRKLAAEGVARIIVCTDDPKRYRRLKRRMAPDVAVWHRDRLDDAQHELAGTPGVTVLIYDQQCAAEARRLRRKGIQPVRPTRVVINQAVCEGCGDCAVQSNCLSVQLEDTEFGPKMHIDQSSCNTDYSCLLGDCPSLVTVEATGPAPETGSRPEPPAVPDPPGSVPREAAIFLAGVGGTGVVTVNQVLGTAALLDGMDVHGLDQTGLSQKAGPVTSHLRLGVGSSRLGVCEADCYLAFDLLVGADGANLEITDPSRTVAVACTSASPTGSMIQDPDLRMPSSDSLVDRIAGRAAKVVTLDSHDGAHALFGDTAQANLLLVGAAFQAGAIPLHAASIEEAIRLNGVAVEANVDAFRWGRVAVADPAAYRSAVGSAPGTVADPEATARRAGLDLGGLTGETRRLAAVRAVELIGYQNTKTARSYLQVLQQVWTAERAAGERTEFSAAVARGLYKLTAYKDEYEVARLLTDPDFAVWAGREVPGSRRIRYRLHPPVLRAMGMKRKIAIGPSLRPGMRILARGKVLRGTPLDPFGRAKMRRLERELVADYRTMVLGLDLHDYDTAVAAASAADLVRGYEDIKLAGVEAYRARLAELGVA